jgi:hypothetical protein
VINNVFVCTLFTTKTLENLKQLVIIHTLLNIFYDCDLEFLFSLRTNYEVVFIHIRTEEISTLVKLFFLIFKVQGM